MKTRLDQLTTAEFIDLVCGNKDVILGKHEIPNPYKLTIALRNIVMEYRSIADPGGNATYLQRVDAIIKSRIAVTVYSMCQNLVLLGQLERTREVLIAAGLPAEGWNDKRIESEVHIQLQKSKRAFDEADKDDDNSEEEKENIRNAFNGMIAAMMAHFKFQIDVVKMMAPVFAHLVARYHAEMKAMKKAMKQH
ncbi:hypothetical protein [uncultured Duncaniella sp.]|uniref:hypothetical protein n=1 Tax=uncultured Duncaniella sp. TaxID=2768039 RepID=UPI0025B636DB|nr:hypothetical protein [uncultured Duncaniella sp.]